MSKIFQYFLIKGKLSFIDGNTIRLPKHTDFYIYMASCSEKKKKKKIEVQPNQPPKTT